MRLLLFNLATDIDDPILGFTSRWISALAERVDFIHVITMRAGRIAVPQNVAVHSLGKENNFSELRRGARFCQLLTHILRTGAIDVCFSHMIPILSVLAAPVLKLWRIPLLTWYAHPRLTVMLKVAHAASDYMLASLQTAYPYKSDKLIVIGQGIDTDIFCQAMTSPQKPPMILCVGRLSPVKGHPTLLRATALLRTRWREPFHVAIVGGRGTSTDEAYIRSLHAQIHALGLESIVSLEPPVTQAEVVSWYQKCTVHVNLTPTGSGDKVAWEAMSCARPCLAANTGFAETFGAYNDLLSFAHGDAEGLAVKLETQLRLLDGEREQVGSYLRERVIQQHSLVSLADKLVTLFGQARQGDTVGVQSCKRYSE